MPKCSICNTELVQHCRHGQSASCTSGYRCTRHGKDWAKKTGAGFFSAGRSGSGDKCRKCHRQTVNCSQCKGVQGRQCNKCGGTGQTCPVDGRYWK